MKHKAKRSLLLEYDLQLVPEEGSEVVSCLAGPIKSVNKEPAGHSFHHFALLQSGLLDSRSEEGSSDGEGATESDATSTYNVEDDQPPPGVRWKSTGKKKKSKKSDAVDLYALLGLQNERWTATEQQIKNAYKKTALEHHPDKRAASVEDEDEKREIEERFKRIQEAYETLSDPAKRREFDSTDDFDDSLPTECATEDFFKVFAPAFRRNSRWSINKPVPDLGDEATAWERVDAFYDFWYGFRSWREFPHPDEEEVDESEGREVRRWVARMNAKLREQGKKEETRRFKAFVENAYRRDPRVVKRKEEERAERERRRRSKAEAAAAKRAEEEQAAAEAAARAAEEAAQAAESQAEAKKQRQAQRKAQQRERARLRAASADLQGLLLDALDILFEKLTLEPLQELNQQLYADGLSDEQKVDIINEKVREAAGEQECDKLNRLAAAAEAARATAAAQAAEAAAKANKAKDWGEEEVRMLEKAVARFPQGTPKRWEQVTAYVRTRTMPEVLDMVKHGLKAGKFAPKQDTFNVAKKRVANTAIASAATQRVESFSDIDVNISGEAVKVLIANGNSNNNGAASRAASADPAAPAAEPETPPGTDATPAASEAPAAGAWSEEQELALVKGMKQYGKEVVDRWEHVSKVVPGKTKAQCFKHFKELRNTIRSKKDGV